MRTSRLPMASFLLGLACVVPVAEARDLKVTTTADEYDGLCNTHCSLRDAVQAAATTDQPRIILGAGTYTLNLPPEHDEEGAILDEDENLNGDLDIKGYVRVTGAGMDQTTIDGGGIDRIFEVLAGSTLALERLRLTNGRTSFYGGALENHGATSLNQVAVNRNTAASGFEIGHGGGLANFGDMTIVRSRIEDNYAGGSESSLGEGGGLYNESNLLIRDSLFLRNRGSDDNDVGLGGGLLNKGTADIARTAFVNNGVQAHGSGSAIANTDGGYLKLSNSTLSGNSSGEYGGATLNNGQRYPATGAKPVAHLVHVTIAGNQGYGLANHGDVLIRNSVISGNIGFFEDAEPMNCYNEGTYTYRATGLLLGTGPGNCTGSQTIANEATFTTHLFPLEENNGTLVHPLRRQSLAIDRAIGSCSSHDQRRLTRPRDGDGDGQAVCDLGAFERARP